MQTRSLPSVRFIGTRVDYIIPKRSKVTGAATYLAFLNGLFLVTLRVSINFCNNVPYNLTVNPRP